MPLCQSLRPQGAVVPLLGLSPPSKKTPVERSPASISDLTISATAPAWGLIRTSHCEVIPRRIEDRRVYPALTNGDNSQEPAGGSNPPPGGPRQIPRRFLCLRPQACRQEPSDRRQFCLSVPRLHYPPTPGQNPETTFLVGHNRLKPIDHAVGASGHYHPCPEIHQAWL